jgi:hypothetical protein
MYRVKEADRKEQRSKRLKRFATPYSLRESLGIVRRNITGVDAVRNEAGIECIPQSVSLKKDCSSLLRVGFVGDIMELSTRYLTIGEFLHAYLSECDFLVGNFEATIHTQKKRHGTILGTPQIQAERIIDDLAAIFPPERFYLSLANNHSGDYEKSVFDKSCKLLIDRGFPLFGMNDAPFVDPHPAVRIVTGTMWSNQNADDIVWLHAPEEASSYTRSGAVNILYPHWGYELEAYPRRFIVDMAQQYARKYDAIIGHHAHNPQPVSLINQVPIAFGLGDFCYHYDLPTYKYGLVARVEIARSSKHDHSTKSFDWQMIEAHHDGQEIHVDIQQALPSWLCTS